MATASIISTSDNFQRSRDDRTASALAVATIAFDRCHQSTETLNIVSVRIKRDRQEDGVFQADLAFQYFLRQRETMEQSDGIATKMINADDKVGGFDLGLDVRSQTPVARSPTGNRSQLSDRVSVLFIVDLYQGMQGFTRDDRQDKAGRDPDLACVIIRYGAMCSTLHFASLEGHTRKPVSWRTCNLTPVQPTVVFTPWTAVGFLHWRQ